MSILHKSSAGVGNVLILSKKGIQYRFGIVGEIEDLKDLKVSHIRGVPLSGFGEKIEEWVSESFARIDIPKQQFVAEGVVEFNHVPYLRVYGCFPVGIEYDKERHPTYRISFDRGEVIWRS